MPGCTAEASRPLNGVDYDAKRCAEPKDLLAHGVTPEKGMGVLVYPFLGGRYRVEYEITGEAPISEAKVEYLARHLPLAAKLASRFSKTKYSIAYVDAGARRFHATRADKLRGDAELLFFDESRRAYFGWGSSKFGPWELRGSAYVDVRFRKGLKNPAGVAYEVRIRTAPTNAMINAIMHLGLFKGQVTGQIEATMRDLTGAAAAVSTQGADALLKDPAFSPEEREQVMALLAIP